MSLDPLEPGNTSWVTFPRDPIAIVPTTYFGNLRLPNYRRFVGDGLDLRRPIMSQPRRNVIDLTEESNSPPNALPAAPAPTIRRSEAAIRGPRFERDIIDVEQEPEVLTPRDESPEIQFIASRPRSRSLSRPRHVNPPRVPGMGRAAPTRNPGVASGSYLPSPAAMLGLRTPHSDTFPHTPDDLVAFESVGGHMFEPPELDFLMQGFNYTNPSRPPPHAPLPTYEAPPPARPGFTRSPNEDDVMVCPNCEDELGVADDEVKRQVWISKACGHVSFTCNYLLG